MFDISIFKVSDVHAKLAALEATCSSALALTSRVAASETARDCEVRAIWRMPPKIGFGKKEGQARLLHDLANIELQATELAVRTLCEFPDAPFELREELASLAIDEGRHLSLCLKGLTDLGFRWGDWPIHMSLWDSVSDNDSLLDRLVIVHRYLEGAGLDAGVEILKKLRGSGAKEVERVVETIVKEEVGHVAFGSKWYHKICNEQKIDITADFRDRILKVIHRNPKKENLAYEVRKKAGFLDQELQVLEEIRREHLSKPLRLF